MTDIIKHIKEALTQNADEATKINGKRFFKEEVKTYGVKTSIVSKIAKDSFKIINNYSKGDIFKICEELWKSGMMEESFIACNWSYKIKESYTEDDFLLFEKWVNQYVINWASCDTLCNHTIGSFLEMYPAYINELKKWAKSENRWVRRASAVSLIIPAKNGLFKKEIFEIADSLLMDTDDLVQKGYGWMLKSACNKYEEDVYRYVLSKRAVMPRTALRYAIEKMPKEKKAEAMKKGTSI